MKVGLLAIICMQTPILTLAALMKNLVVFGDSNSGWRFCSTYFCYITLRHTLGDRHNKYTKQIVKRATLE
jgi:hypothetical protein